MNIKSQYAGRSGAVAERIKIPAYFIYSFVVTANCLPRGGPLGMGGRWIHGQCGRHSDAACQVTIFRDAKRTASVKAVPAKPQD